MCYIYNTFYISLLDPIKSTLIRPHGLPAMPSATSVKNDHEYFEVQDILDSHRIRNRLEYLIKWKGYPDFWQFLRAFLAHPGSQPHQPIPLLKSYETRLISPLNPHCLLPLILQPISLELLISLHLNLLFFHYVPPKYLCFLRLAHAILESIFKLFVVFSYICS